MRLVVEMNELEESRSSICLRARRKRDPKPSIASVRNELQAGGGICVEPTSGTGGAEHLDRERSCRVG